MNQGEVDLWAVHLRAGLDALAFLSETLSPDERERAQNFLFEKHRKYFIVGRGLLRAILGQYLQQPPAQLHFCYGVNGKPTLCVGGVPQLHFSLAHSEDCAVYGISRDSELGVDIELVRELSDIEAVAKSFFSPEECGDLHSIGLDRRAEAFLNCWTRKEAYLKATGDGLSVPLDRFRVSLKPGDPASFLKLEGDRYPLSRWSLRHLVPLNGCIGALAIPTPILNLRKLAFGDAEECLQYLQKSFR